MTLDELVAQHFAGEKHRKEGRGHYMVCCPIHGDSNPSMSLTEGDNGKILVKCFACGAGAQELADHLGLSISDFMGPKTEKPLSDWEVKVGRFVCQYDYTDEDGNILFSKERRVKTDGSKTFLQKIPAPPGSVHKWKYGSVVKYLAERKMKRPLYRLKDLLFAVRTGKPVWFVEGEKDVETLRDLGLEATTTVDGAGGGWEEHYAAWFDGAKVVYIVPDNDKPPANKNAKGWQGQQFAVVKRAALIERGVNCHVVELPSVVLGKSVKDVTDFFDAGGTVEELEDLARAAESTEWIPPWERPDAPEIPDAVDAESVTKTSAKSEKVLQRSWKNEELPLETRLQAFADWLKYRIEKRDDTIAWCVSQILQLDWKGVREIARSKILAQTVVAWLNHVGRLYYHSVHRDFATEMFFLHADKTLCTVASDWFSSWVSRHTGINREDARFKKIRAAIQDEALQGESAIGVTPEFFFARREGAIYISCGVGQMAKVTGGRVEMVDNGTDGVLFSVEKVLKPWKLTKTPRDPFSTCQLWTGMETTAQQRLLFKLWALCLPHMLEAKPPISMSGGAGSGKTAVVRGLFRLFGLEQRNVSVDPGDKGENALWVQLHAGGLLLLDNVDIAVKWFANSLEAASTGATKEVKRLYTDAEIAQLVPRANIAITSLRSLFASSQALSDRMIHIHLERVSGKETKESSLYHEIEACRDDAMTFVAQTIAKVLADDSPAQHVNRRHPDWGAIAVKTGRALGIEEQAVKALQAAEMDKYVSNLKSDAFGEMVMRLVRQPMTVDAAHFAELIKHEYGEDYYRRAGWNPVKVGKSIERLSESLKILYQLSKRILRGKAIYSLAPSKMIMDELNEDTNASAPSNSVKEEINSSNLTTYEEYGEEDDVFEIL